MASAIPASIGSFGYLTRILVSSLLSLTTVPCKKDKICKDGGPSISQTPYTGTELRTDGVYFGLPSKDYREVVSRRVYVLYRNGVFLKAGSTQDTDPIPYIKSVTESGIYSKAMNGWGAYQVVGNDIEISVFVANMYCRKCEDMAITIVNDTTITVAGYDLSKQHDVYNDTMHFIKSEKPDSTNWYFNN